MTKKEELLTPENLAAQPDTTSAAAEAVEAGRRSFVEPEISVPVDVLEATTFFQAATNGATN